MRGFGTEIKVGIFTVAGLSVLVTMIVILEGTLFKSERQEFHTLLDNVGGVGIRTQVRTAGVQVGEVTGIEVLDKGAKVIFAIKPDVRIPEGSYIEIKSRGIMGDVFIEIVRNQNSQQALEPGNFIPKYSEQNDFNSLMNLVGSIARDLQTVSRTLASVFGSSDGKSSLENILHNVEQITADTRELIAEERHSIANAIEKIEVSSTRLASLLERNDTKVDDILDSVRVAAADFRVFSTELRSLVDKDNSGKLQNVLTSVDQISTSLRETTSRIQRIVAKVEAGEGTLGQIISKDDTANELNATLKSVKDLLGPANRLKVQIDYHGELRTKKAEQIGNFGSHFNVRLMTRPDRYYLLGVSDSPGSRRVSTTTTETTTATSPDGTPTTVETERVETPDERPALRFNAQFAKRFNALGVRVGIFESYPGIAADAYLFNDNLVASVEAFNFTDRETNEARQTPDGMVRVKAYGSLSISNNFYLSGGVDNMGKDPGPVPFFGAGVRFTDEDFKTIIGAASFVR